MSSSGGGAWCAAARPPALPAKPAPSPAGGPPPSARLDQVVSMLATRHSRTPRRAVGGRYGAARCSRWLRRGSRWLRRSIRIPALPLQQEEQGSFSFRSGIRVFSPGIFLVRAIYYAAYY